MKNWWQSKTIWWNALTAVSVLIAAPEITSLLGESSLRYLMAFQAAINVILRYAFTREAVK